MFESHGTLIFDPLAKSGNKTSLFKNNWAILELNDDIGDYYSWFIRRRYDVRLQKPAWGNHVSIIRGEETSIENWNKFKDMYNNKTFKFEYDNLIKTNGNHWRVRIYCDAIKDLREEMGYPRNGLWGLHLTIGSPVPQQLAHSFYIWECIKRYEMDDIDIDWKRELETNTK